MKAFTLLDRALRLQATQPVGEPVHIVLVHTNVCLKKNNNKKGKGKNSVYAPKVNGFRDTIF